MAGIREQCERAGKPSGNGLDDCEAGRERQRETERAQRERAWRCVVVVRIAVMRGEAVIVGMRQAHVALVLGTWPRGFGAPRHIP